MKDLLAFIRDLIVYPTDADALAAAGGTGPSDWQLWEQEMTA